MQYQGSNGAVSEQQQGTRFKGFAFGPGTMGTRYLRVLARAHNAPNRPKISAVIYVLLMSSIPFCPWISPNQPL